MQWHCVCRTAIICRAMYARTAAPSITRIQKWSSAAFPSGKTRCCCAAAPSNPDTGCGPCRRVSWKTVRPRRKARHVRPGKKPAPALKWASSIPCITCRTSIRCISCSAPGLLDLDFQPGIESLETRLFTEAEIPWDQIAFRTVRATLEQYFSDRRSGSFDFHFGDIRPL